MQQELMVGTNRLPPRRVTAFGGGLMGFTLGLLVSYGAYAVLLQGHRNAASVEMTAVTTELQGKISALTRQTEQQLLQFNGTPVLFLARQAEANALDVRKAMDQFPAFKTDPYRQLFTDLGNLVDHQRQQSRAIITALSDPQVEQSARCKVASTAPTGDPLWAQQSVSFSKDGWRGVTP